jgi:hypothetical protein
MAGFIVVGNKIAPAKTAPIPIGIARGPKAITQQPKAVPNNPAPIIAPIAISLFEFRDEGGSCI